MWEHSANSIKMLDFRATGKHVQCKPGRILEILYKFTIKYIINVYMQKTLTLYFLKEIPIPFW